MTPHRLLGLVATSTLVLGACGGAIDEGTADSSAIDAAAETPSIDTSPVTEGSVTPDTTTLPDTAPMVEVSPPIDVIPPTFGGCTGVSERDVSSYLVSWNGAMDDKTPPWEMVYAIYFAETPGGESFGAPLAITSPGVTSVTVTTPPPKTCHGPFYFVCRARDHAGNMESNTVEVSVKSDLVPKPPCFGGLVSVEEVTSSSALLEWVAATDAKSAPAAIRYSIYAGPSAGEDFSAPLVVTTPGATSYRMTGLPSASRICFVVRAKNAAGTEELNVVERCVTTL